MDQQTDRATDRPADQHYHATSKTKNSDKPSVHYLPCTKWQVSDLLLKKVEHLATKELVETKNELNCCLLNV